MSGARDPTDREGPLAGTGARKREISEYEGGGETLADPGSAKTLWADHSQTLPSSGQATDEQATGGLSDALGSTERYEVFEEAGRGGMGVVYRARHRSLDKQVAIKVLLPGAPVERFLQEARILARIDSPHVVEIHDFARNPS